MPKVRLANLLTGCALLGALGCASAVSKAPTQTVSKTIRLGGSSETYEILEQLAEGYSDTNSYIEFKFASPSQTSAGIQGVKAEQLDIGALSRPITEAEKSEGLKYVSLMEVPLVIMVHQSVTGISDITAEQIKSIYSGEITNWKEIGGPDANINLLDLPEDENEKQVLRRTYLGESLKIKSEAIVFSEDDELVERAATLDFSIAAVPLEDELSELPVTILSIDSVEPSDENVQSGKYLMSMTLGMVASQTASEATEDFLAFVTSEAGQQILENAEEEED